MDLIFKIKSNFYWEMYKLIKNIDEARKAVERSKDDFDDFIYDLINKSFDAGRKAEYNRNKTGSTKGYKNELWKIHIEDGVESLNRAVKLARAVENLNTFTK